MQMEHIYFFPGTWEELISRLNQYPHSTYSGTKSYILNDYIVEIRDEKIRFGIGRIDHLCGFWFEPVISNPGYGIEFRGMIEYEGKADDRSRLRKAIDRMEEWVLGLFILPFVSIYFLIDGLIRKIRHLPKREKDKTNDEKLQDLMENFLGCKEISEELK